MLISGGQVFVDGAFFPGSVTVEGDRIAAVDVTALRAGEDCSLATSEGARVSGDGAGASSGTLDAADSDEVVLDAHGCYVIPGLIDLHFHAAMGADFCDGTVDAIATMAAYEAKRGVTAICPATMTYPMEVLEPVARAAAAFSPSECESALVGINMEGPYISPDKVGAQNPAYVRGASVEELDRLQELSGGLFKIVDVAPEEPGNLDFIRKVSGSVRVSLAHTVTDYDCAVAAFEAGARHMTHLYNAMPGLHHREPGPIAAAAERDDVTAEIIADGIHIHPAMVRLAFNLFGDDRMILISDTLRAVGLGDGIHDLGGQDVEVKGKVATLMRTGALAGSVSDLATCLQTAICEMGIPPESAVKAATVNPARALGIDGSRGSLTPGKVADVVVLDGDYNVKHVVLRGVLLDV